MKRLLYALFVLAIFSLFFAMLIFTPNGTPEFFILVAALIQWLRYRKIKQ